MTGDIGWPFRRVRKIHFEGSAFEHHSFDLINERDEKLYEFSKNNKNPDSVMCCECACIFESKDTQSLKVIEDLFGNILEAPSNKQPEYFLKLCPECFVIESRRLLKQEARYLRPSGPAYF